MTDALGQTCSEHGRQGCLHRSLEGEDQAPALDLLYIGGGSMTMVSESECG
jgi:hypothetical protein